jgi:hypothetical protein
MCSKSNEVSGWSQVLLVVWLLWWDYKSSRFIATKVCAFVLAVEVSCMWTTYHTWTAVSSVTAEVGHLLHFLYRSGSFVMDSDGGGKGRFQHATSSKIKTVVNCSLFVTSLFLMTRTFTANNYSCCEYHHACNLEIYLFSSEHYFATSQITQSVSLCTVFMCTFCHENS